jgi:trimeric autotransporter adhesin
MKLIPILFAGTALALSVAAGNAQNILVDKDVSGLNALYTSQSVGDNEIRSTQNGSGNRSFMYQTGNDNVANVRQFGISNYANANQKGSSDVVRGIQSGDYNFAVVRQDDSGGDRRRVALYNQSGDNNRVVITQKNHPVAGDSSLRHQYAKSTQIGEGNKAHITQYTAGSIVLFQSGTDNNARIQQTRNSGIGETAFNRATVSMLGSDNYVNLYQTGAAGGNTAVIMQDGSNNNAKVTQYGSRGRVNIEQNGNGNSIDLRQGGISLNYSVVQNGGAAAVVVQN